MTFSGHQLSSDKEALLGHDLHLRGYSQLLRTSFLGEGELAQLPAGWAKVGKLLFWKTDCLSQSGCPVVATVSLEKFERAVSPNFCTWKTENTLLSWCHYERGNVLPCAKAIFLSVSGSLAKMLTILVLILLPW